MTLVLISLGITLLAAIAAMVNNHSPERVARFSAALGVSAAVVGLIPCLGVLAGGRV